MALLKPDTTRFPLAVLAWALHEVRARGFQIDVYHDIGADVVLAFDYTGDAPVKQSFSRKNATALASDILRRFAPDLTMPPRFVHRSQRPPEPPAAPSAKPQGPPPAPPPTQAELRARAQTPLDAASINNLQRPRH